MRAEDRKPSKRVFPLLQNVDLDSVTFANVQGVGDPISIEDMNEQEMLDLIIVNLARLCVKSEWTGLLETAAGGFTPSTPGSVTDGEYVLSPIGTMADTVNDATLAGSIFATPFICPTGGLSLTTSATVGCTITVATAAASATVLVGIYDASATYSPDTLLAQASFDASTTGSKTNAWDTAVDLTAGTLYFVALLRPNGESGTVDLECVKSTASPMIGRREDGYEYNQIAHATSTSTTLPATWTGADVPYNRKIPMIGVPV
jgi:hypothetical protein